MSTTKPRPNMMSSIEPGGGKLPVLHVVYARADSATRKSAIEIPMRRQSRKRFPEAVSVAMYAPATANTRGTGSRSPVMTPR